MADRSGYIGRAPSDSSIIVARQTNQPTSTTSTFVFNSGYDVGYLDIYVNGSKLINALDYTATDTRNVTLTTAAVNGDVIEFVAYKAFNLANVLSSAPPGNFTVDGSLSIPDKIIHTGDTNTAIRFPAADTFTVETAGSEALRVDSSGRLLLGTTTEGYAFADTLTIAESGNSGITIRSGTTNSGAVYFSDATSGTGEYDGWVDYSHNNRTMHFGVAATERLRITSAGDVHIGTTNAVVFGSRRALTVANGTTGAVLSLYNSTTATNNPRISSNPGGSEINDIGIHAASTNGNIIAYTNNDTERLRISSTGNVGIGTDNPLSRLHVSGTHNSHIRMTNTSDDGLELIGDANRSNANTTTLAIKSRWNGTEVSKIVFQTDADTTNKDDGKILFHTKSSGSSISERLRITSGGEVQIANGNLKFSTAGTGIDFSSNANAAGMTSELLDDYEEGTWTPIFDTSISGGTLSGITYDQQQGKYRKIGSMVYIEGLLRTTAVTNGGNGTYDISGLPFTASADNTNGSFFCYSQHSWTNAPHQFGVVANTDHARARGGISVGDATYTNGAVNDFDTASGSKNRVYFSGWYTTV